jgi:NADH-quinone oxidoreductase subunit H
MDLFITIVIVAIVLGGIMGVCAYLIFLERKIAAWVQDRHGPNRVGPWGLLQSVADGLKFLLKEQVVPTHVSKVIYFIAPSIAVLTTLLAFAVVPFGPPPPPGEEYPAGFRFIIAPNLDVGLVFIFSVTSLAVYAIILGGWASNSKYSLLGCIRSSAQVISYEIPLGMSLLGVILLTGSLNLEKIVLHQAAGGFFAWNIWIQPLAWLIFFTAALAESNRMPFDLPEAEQELVGGYHTEYSAMKFAFFFLGEYTHVITVSFLLSIIFFGGWHFPWIAEPASSYAGVTIVKLLVLFAKVAFFIVLIMLIRWTIPRFRFDQLMGLAWKVLIPLALLNFVAVMFVKHFELHPLWLLPLSLGLFVGAGVVGTLTPAAESERPEVTDIHGREAAAKT